ncbi:hypothetical protein [Peribacillus muralis]
MKYAYTAQKIEKKGTFEVNKTCVSKKKSLVIGDYQAEPRMGIKISFSVF